MTIENVLSFVNVHRYNGFRRAAEAMFLTQPTLSARIQALERELGAQLLVRARGRRGAAHRGGGALPPLRAANRQRLHPGRHRRLHWPDAARDRDEHLHIHNHAAARLPEAAQPPSGARRGAGYEPARRAPEAPARRGVRLPHNAELRPPRPHGDTRVPRQDFAGRAAGHPLLSRGTPPDYSQVALENIICSSAMQNYWEVILRHFKSRGVTPNVTLVVDSVEIAKNMVLQGPRRRLPARAGSGEGAHRGLARRREPHPRPEREPGHQPNLPPRRHPRLLLRLRSRLPRV